MKHSDDVGFSDGREEKLVVCSGCGRKALEGDGGVTAGGDTWWRICPPFEVAVAAEQGTDRNGFSHACSPDCAARAIDRLRPAYERLEEELVNHPEHIHEEGDA